MAGIAESEEIFDTKALQDVIGFCLKKIRDMCKSGEIESYNLTGSQKRPWFIVTKTQLNTYLAKRKAEMQGTKSDVVIVKRGKGGKFQSKM